MEPKKLFRGDNELYCLKEKGGQRQGWTKSGVGEDGESVKAEQTQPVPPQLLLQKLFLRITGAITVRDLLLSGKLSVEKESSEGSIKGY